MKDLLDHRRQILSRTIPRVSMGMKDGVRVLKGYVRDVRGVRDVGGTVTYKNIGCIY